MAPDYLQSLRPVDSPLNQLARDATLYASPENLCNERATEEACNHYDIGTHFQAVGAMLIVE